MPWRELARFRDPAVPKLHNLRRAAARGLRVPRTYWIAAHEEPPPPPPLPFPIILRSGSPTEDTRETSNAGQLLSLRVAEPDGYAEALARVVAALPSEASGRKRGAVFAQSLVKARAAGIAFFDGFYYERTFAQGGNEALTSGQARGEVTRGHVERADGWSDWLLSIHRAFGADARGSSGAIDVEVARDEEGYVLLQVRPALFPVARNESLSLSNHREILGDLPSPWITSVLLEAGREALSFFAAVDPGIAAWNESYAVLLAERCFGNDSFFFRLMDRWGLPRSFVTEGFGGREVSAADRKVVPSVFLASAPRLLALQARNLRAALAAPRRLADLDRQIAAARTLPELHAANVAGLGLALTTNFAINGILSGIVRVRRALGIRGAVRVVTQEMMERFSAIAAIADAAARDGALRAWLADYGHRGPLESDPARPRFRELEEVLRTRLASMSAAAPGGTDAPAPDGAKPPHRLLAPLFWADERREWFRSELMRRWEPLRSRILDEGRRLVAAGLLEKPDDVFLLTGAEPSSLDEVRGRRARLEAARALSLPTACSRDEVVALVRSAAEGRLAASGARTFPGIPLSSAVVEGTALRADDLVALLAGGLPAAGTILVVPALEPSWALVFPQVAGVVAEVGGELSHASILLREAGKPAIVNCARIFQSVATGDRLRLDGAAGVVSILG